MGYGYDYVNSDVVLHRLSFQGAQVVPCSWCPQALSVESGSKEE